jgi:TolA-binding protein
MRFHLLGLVLLASVAAPAAAQRDESVERRVDRLEQEMRAVQRRVFPGGRTQFVEPEIRPEERAQPSGGVSGDALASLAARVDALESQLRSLTGQVEEQGYRTRQLEEQIARLRSDLGGRLERLETPAREPEPEPAPAVREPETAAAEPAAEQPAAPADAAEEAYNAGYRLWNSQRYAEAQQVLEAAATRFPATRWTSWMRNLQGRAYLDDDKPATAARIFLANYQDNPQGERAADSLYYLGQALTRLNRRAEACRVYGELEQVYPNMRASLRGGLPRARADARCGETADRR